VTGLVIGFANARTIRNILPGRRSARRQSARIWSWESPTVETRPALASLAMSFKPGGIRMAGFYHWRCDPFRRCGRPV